MSPLSKLPTPITLLFLAPFLELHPGAQNFSGIVKEFTGDRVVIASDGATVSKGQTLAADLTSATRVYVLAFPTSAAAIRAGASAYVKYTRESGRYVAKEIRLVKGFAPDYAKLPPRSPEPASPPPARSSVSASSGVQEQLPGIITAVSRGQFTLALDRNMRAGLPKGTQFTFILTPQTVLEDIVGGGLQPGTEATVSYTTRGNENMATHIWLRGRARGQNAEGSPQGGYPQPTRVPTPVPRTPGGSSPSVQAQRATWAFEKLFIVDDPGKNMKEFKVLKLHEYFYPLAQVRVNSSPKPLRFDLTLKTMVDGRPWGQPSTASQVWNPGDSWRFIPFYKMRFDTPIQGRVRFECTVKSFYVVHEPGFSPVFIELPTPQTQSLTISVMQ